MLISKTKRRSSELSNRQASQRSPVRRSARLGRAAMAVLESLEGRRLMTTAVWTGSGGDNNWNTANNWQGDVVPASGQDVDFPSSASGTAVNLASNVTVGNISMDAANYSLTTANGSDITLGGNISVTGTNHVFASIVLTHNATITVSPGGGMSLGSVSDGGNGYGITKAGIGEMAFNQPSTYTGSTVVSAGVIDADSTSDSAFTIDSGATLHGTSTTGAITDNGGFFGPQNFSTIPSTYTSSGNDSFGSGSTFLEEIFSSLNSKLVANGSSVNLTGSALQLVPFSTPSVGTVYTVIANNTGSAVTGTFNGLPEGSVISSTGSYYRISYVGGASGHDVILTVVNNPAATKAVFTTQPTNIAASAPQSIAVSLENASNTVDTGDTANVTLSIASGPNGATLGGTLTVPAVAGVASFSGVTFSQAGTYTLTASSNGLTAGTSQSITVSGAAIWTGAGNDGQWNTATNWQGNVVPVSGQSVEFPDLGSSDGTINVATNVNVGTITFDGAGYTLSGSGSITSTGINDNADGNQIDSVLELTQNTTVTVAASDDLQIQSADDGGNNYAVDKAGAGTLTFSGISTFTGGVNVNEGNVELGGGAGLNSTINSNSGTSAYGSGGSYAAGFTGGGGTFLLADQGAAGELATNGNIDLQNGTTLNEAIGSSSAGEFVITGGTVNLTGANLQVTLLNGVTPTAGQIITVISNQAGFAVVGTFNGLPEGSLFSSGGVTYQVSYAADSENDVTLTVIAPAVWTGGGGDGQWNTAANWQADAVPASGQSVEFPDLGSNDGTVNVATNVNVGSITFDGAGYTLSGPGEITLTGITDNATGNQIISDISIQQNAGVSVAASDDLQVQWVDDLGDGYAINKQGAGTLTFNYSTTFTGGLNVNQGNVELASGASILSQVYTSAGTTLYGNNAQIEGLSGSGGTILLEDQNAPGTLTAGTNVYVQGGMVLDETIGASSSGELDLNGGDLYLTGSTLQVTCLNGATPSPGQVIRVVQNVAGDLVNGTFNNLPEGALFTTGGVTYQISYNGNGEHDVTLTVIGPAVWTGGGGDGQWNTAANWQADAVPLTGQSVDFPDINGSTVQDVNLASDVEVGDITMEGNYTFDGSNITIDGDITASNTADTFESNAVLTHDTTLTVGLGDNLTVGGYIGGAGDYYAISLVGGGTVQIPIGGEADVREANVQDGTLVLDGEADSVVTVDPGGTVEGGGIYDNGIIGNGGTISLGNSASIYDINTPSVTFADGTTLHEELSSNAGTEEDGELVVGSGLLNLADANLTLSSQNGFTPAVGDVITLISNQTGNAVTGTFNGLAQGAIATLGGLPFQISYSGGASGHDVTLTAVAPTATWTGLGNNNNWSNPNNWQGDVVPLAHSNVIFPADNYSIEQVSVDQSVIADSITFHGSYQFNGSIPIQLDGAMNEDAGQQMVFNAPVQMDQSLALNMNGYGIFFDGVSAQTAGLTITKSGSGMANFRYSTLAASGETEVSDGDFLLAAQSSASSIQVDSGATFIAGGGEAVSVNVSNGGTFISQHDAGDGLTVDSGLAFASGSTLSFQLSKFDNGNTLDPVGITVSSGPIDLNSATLDFTTAQFTASNSDELTLIHNNTGSAVSGTFAGLPEGSIITVNGHKYALSYVGGQSGHDVTLTALQTAVWTGGGGDGQWNTAANWQADAVPLAGQDVDFPDINGSTRDEVNLATAATVGNITMEGDYGLEGSSITINGNVTTSGSDDGFGDTTNLTHSTTLTVGAGDYLVYTGNIVDGGNEYGITVAGGGTVQIKADASYTGATGVQNGTLDNEGDMQSAITVDSGATVEGSGTYNSGIIGSGGTISLGTGTSIDQIYEVAVPSVSFSNGTTLHEELGSNAGTEVDGKLTVTGGTINLTGSNLTLATQNGFTPAPGDVITLISNQTGEAVTGTFNGLAQGGIVTVGGVHYHISYTGGESGHDVTLTVPNAQVIGPTIVSVLAQISTRSVRPTLSILAADPNLGNDSDLTYTWSVVSAPGGASSARFSDNGTNTAKNATVRLARAGTYNLLCTISNGDGGITTQAVTLIANQFGTQLRLTPHQQNVNAGQTIQYAGALLDQFGRTLAVSTPNVYVVKSGQGKISSTGLYTAGKNPGHVVIQITVGNLTGTCGATIVPPSAAKSHVRSRK